ncbi:MAG: hypothetical protein ABI656_08765 [bacterium]
MTLNAEQQLYASRSDLVLAHLRMRSAAGTLNDQDLVNIARYFMAGQ